MAYCKTFLLLGLALAVVLVISREVSARDLAEVAQAQETMQTDGVDQEATYGHGYGHGHGHGYGHGHGHGHGYGHGPGHGHHPPVHGAGATQEETESNQN